MRTVLIIDSSAVTCHTVSKQLRTYGFDTIEARSISGARVALASKPVDLVILDPAATAWLSLPEAGGTTVLREMKAACTAGARAAQQIPVIILTSSTRDSDRIDAQAAGAAAFLTKPVSTSELLVTVNSALALHVPTAHAAPMPQPSAIRQADPGSRGFARRDLGRRDPGRREPLRRTRSKGADRPAPRSTRLRDWYPEWAPAAAGATAGAVAAEAGAAVATSPSAVIG